MARCGLACLLLGALAWGQAANSNRVASAGAEAGPAKMTAEAIDLANRSGGDGDLPPSTPVITIDGLCESPPGESGSAACRTVVTRADFEKLIQAVKPKMPARSQREFANKYAQALIMSEKAVEMGLDQGPAFEGQMRLARIQILNGALNKALWDKAAQVSDKDIEDYYRNNKPRYEQVDLDRVYVPKPLGAPDTKPSTTARVQAGETAVDVTKALVEKLRTRALAGEDFTKLQADAWRMTAMKGPPPDVAMQKITRSALPPGQGFVVDLRAGEISKAIEEQSGYVVYKVKSNGAVGLDEIREEIKSTLRAQRAQDAIRNINESIKPVFNESYFASPRPEPNSRENTDPSRKGPDTDADDD